MRTRIPYLLLEHAQPRAPTRERAAPTRLVQRRDILLAQRPRLAEVRAHVPRLLGTRRRGVSTARPIHAPRRRITARAPPFRRLVAIVARRPRRPSIIITITVTITSRVFASSVAIARVVVFARARRARKEEHPSEKQKRTPIAY